MKLIEEDLKDIKREFKEQESEIRTLKSKLAEAEKLIEKWRSVNG